MVVIPAGYFGDFLLANRTNAVLGFPQTDELSSSAKGVDHFDIQAVFKVEFVLWVEGVSVASYLDVSSIRRVSSLDQYPDLTIVLALEDPLTVIHIFEVFIFDPLAGFGRMSSFGPAPESLKDDCIYFGKG